MQQVPVICLLSFDMYIEYFCFIKYFVRNIDFSCLALLVPRDHMQ